MEAPPRSSSSGNNSSRNNNGNDNSGDDSLDVWESVLADTVLDLDQEVLSLASLPLRPPTPPKPAAFLRKDAVKVAHDKREDDHYNNSDDNDDNKMDEPKTYFHRIFRLLMGPQPPSPAEMKDLCTFLERFSKITDWEQEEISYVVHFLYLISSVLPQNDLLSMMPEFEESRRSVLFLLYNCSNVLSWLSKESEYLKENWNPLNVILEMVGVHTSLMESSNMHKGAKECIRNLSVPNSLIARVEALDYSPDSEIGEKHKLQQVKSLIKINLGKLTVQSSTSHGSTAISFHKYCLAQWIGPLKGFQLLFHIFRVNSNSNPFSDLAVHATFETVLSYMQKIPATSLEVLDYSLLYSLIAVIPLVCDWMIFNFNSSKDLAIPTKCLESILLIVQEWPKSDNHFTAKNAIHLNIAIVHFVIQLLKPHLPLENLVTTPSPNINFFSGCFTLLVTCLKYSLYYGSQAQSQNVFGTNILPNIISKLFDDLPPISVENLVISKSDVGKLSWQVDKEAPEQAFDIFSDQEVTVEGIFQLLLSSEVTHFARQSLRWISWMVLQSQNAEKTIVSPSPKTKEEPKVEKDSTPDLDDDVGDFLLAMFENNPNDSSAAPTTDSTQEEMNDGQLNFVEDFINVYEGLLLSKYGSVLLKNITKSDIQEFLFAALKVWESTDVKYPGEIDLIANGCVGIVKATQVSPDGNALLLDALMGLLSIQSAGWPLEITSSKLSLFMALNMEQSTNNYFPYLFLRLQLSVGETKVENLANCLPAYHMQFWCLQYFLLKNEEKLDVFEQVMNLLHSLVSRIATNEITPFNFLIMDRMLLFLEFMLYYCQEPIPVELLQQAESNLNWIRPNTYYFLPWNISITNEALKEKVSNLFFELSPIKEGNAEITEARLKKFFENKYESLTKSLKDVLETLLDITVESDSSKQDSEISLHVSYLAWRLTCNITCWYKERHEQLKELKNPNSKWLMYQIGLDHYDYPLEDFSHVLADYALNSPDEGSYEIRTVSAMVLFVKWIVRLSHVRNESSESKTIIDLADLLEKSGYPITGVKRWMRMQVNSPPPLPSKGSSSAAAAAVPSVVFTDEDINKLAATSPKMLVRLFWCLVHLSNFLVSQFRMAFQEDLTVQFNEALALTVDSLCYGELEDRLPKSVTSNKEGREWDTFVNRLAITSNFPYVSSFPIALDFLYGQFNQKGIIPLKLLSTVVPILAKLSGFLHGMESVPEDAFSECSRYPISLYPLVELSLYPLKNFSILSSLEELFTNVWKSKPSDLSSVAFFNLHRSLRKLSSRKNPDETTKEICLLFLNHISKSLKSDEERKHWLQIYGLPVEKNSESELSQRTKNFIHDKQNWLSNDEYKPCFDIFIQLCTAFKDASVNKEVFLIFEQLLMLRNSEDQLVYFAPITSCLDNLSSEELEGLFSSVLLLDKGSSKEAFPVFHSFLEVYLIAQGSYTENVALESSSQLIMKLLKMLLGQLNNMLDAEPIKFQSLLDILDVIFVTSCVTNDTKIVTVRGCIDFLRKIVTITFADKLPSPMECINLKSLIHFIGRLLLPKEAHDKFVETSISMDISPLVEAYKNLPHIHWPYPIDVDDQSVAAVIDSGTVAASAKTNVNTSEQIMKSHFSQKELTGKDVTDKLCTYLVTGPTYREQHWYYCYTCGFLGSEGCCSVCVQVCHKGHDVAYSRISQFFCDCGPSGNCHALEKRPAAKSGSQQEQKHEQESPGREKEVVAVAGSSTGISSMETTNDEKEPTTKFIKIDQDLLVELLKEFYQLLIHSLKILEANHSVDNNETDGAMDSLVKQFDEGFVQHLTTVERTVSEFSSDILKISPCTIIDKKKSKFKGVDGRLLKQLLQSKVVFRTVVAYCPQYVIVLRDDQTVGILRDSVLDTKSAPEASPPRAISQRKRHHRNQNKDANSISIADDPLGSSAFISNIYMPVDIVHVALNPLNHSYLCIAGLKDVIVCSLFLGNGEINPSPEQITINVSSIYEMSFVIQKVYWIPQTNGHLAIVTDKFVAIYDLCSDTLSPQFLFLPELVAGQIIDATFSKGDSQDIDNLNDIILYTITTTGRIYHQNLAFGAHCGGIEMSQLLLEYSSKTEEVAPSNQESYDSEEEEEEEEGEEDYDQYTPPDDIVGLGDQIPSSGSSIYYSSKLRSLFYSFEDGETRGTLLESCREKIKVNFSIIGATKAPIEGSSEKDVSSKHFQKLSPFVRWIELPNETKPTLYAVSKITGEFVLLNFNENGDLQYKSSSFGFSSRLDGLTITPSGIMAFLESGLLLNINTNVSEESVGFSKNHCLYRETKSCNITDAENSDEPAAQEEQKSWPITFFENATISPCRISSSANANKIFRYKGATDPLSSPSQDSCTFSIALPNEDNVIVGVRVLVGHGNLDKIPTTISILSHEIKPIRNLRHWYDIPFSMSEIANQESTLTLHFGVAYGMNARPTIDSLEVFTGQKDKLGLHGGSNAPGKVMSVGKKMFQYLAPSYLEGVLLSVTNILQNCLPFVENGALQDILPNMELVVKNRSMRTLMPQLRQRLMEFLAQSDFKHLFDIEFDCLSKEIYRLSNTRPTIDSVDAILNTLQQFSVSAPNKLLEAVNDSKEKNFLSLIGDALDTLFRQKLGDSVESTLMIIRVLLWKYVFITSNMIKYSLKNNLPMDSLWKHIERLIFHINDDIRFIAVDTIVIECFAPTKTISSDAEKNGETLATSSGAEYVCDICHTSPLPIRWHCEQCGDYDVCDNCYHEKPHHVESHTLYRIEESSMQISDQNLPEIFRAKIQLILLQLIAKASELGGNGSLPAMRLLLLLSVSSTDQSPSIRLLVSTCFEKYKLSLLDKSFSMNSLNSLSKIEVEALLLVIFCMLLASNSTNSIANKFIFSPVAYHEKSITIHESTSSFTAKLVNEKNILSSMIRLAKTLNQHMKEQTQKDSSTTVLPKIRLSQVPIDLYVFPFFSVGYIAKITKMFPANPFKDLVTLLQETCWRIIKLLLDDSTENSTRNEIIQLAAETNAILPSDSYLNLIVKGALYSATKNSKAEMNLKLDENTFNSTLSTLIAISQKSRNFQDPLPYEGLSELASTLVKLLSVSQLRSSNWQKYCTNNVDQVKVLLDCVLNCDEHIAMNGLTLLRLGIAGSAQLPKQFNGKSRINSESYSSLLQSLQNIKKLHIKRTSSSNSSPSIPNLFELAVSDEQTEEAEKDASSSPLCSSFATESIAQIVSKFLLSSRSKSTRMLAFDFLYWYWRQSTWEQRISLFNVFWQWTPNISLFGSNSENFMNLFTYISHRVILYDEKRKNDDEPIISNEFCSSLVKSFRMLGKQLLEHPNVDVYESLRGLLEFNGYYLEMKPCRSCSFPEQNIQRFEYDQIAEETKYTVNSQLVRFKQRYSVSSVTINFSEVRKSKPIQTVDFYYCNKTVTDINELKNNFRLWQKAGSITLAKNQTLATVNFNIPIVAMNFMIEFSSFYENVIAHEKLICPRCNILVTDKHGICKNCQDNAFQCRQCRFINYENLEGFLCIECGHSRYVKYSINFLSKPVFDVDSIENEQDEKKCLAFIEKQSQTARDSVRKVLRLKGPVSYMLNQILGNSSLDNLAGVIDLPSSVASPSTVNQVNSKVTGLASLYNKECFEAYESLQKSIQILSAARKELQKYQFEIKKIAPVFDGNLSEEMEYTKTIECYGCLSSLIRNMLQLFGQLCSIPKIRTKLVEANLTEDLLQSNLRRHHLASVPAMNVLCLICVDSQEATDKICEYFLKKVDLCLDKLFDGSEVSNLLSNEISLLCQLCLIDDSLWQQRLQVMLSLFFSCVQSTSAVVLTYVVLPCLSVIVKLCNGITGADKKMVPSKSPNVEEVPPISHESWSNRPSGVTFDQIYTQWKNSILGQKDESLRHEYLSRKYGMRWLSKWKHASKKLPSLESLSDPMWIKSLLFNRHSRELRSQAAVLVKTLAKHPKTQVHFLKALTKMLPETTNISGDIVQEYFELFNSLLENTAGKVYLTVKEGVLFTLTSLITENIRRVTHLEKLRIEAESDLSQGIVLKELVLLLKSFLAIEPIERSFKKHKLVGSLLNNYLALRVLFLQQSKITEETSSILLSLVHQATASSDKSPFLEACILSLGNYIKSSDRHTPKFILEQLCETIHPVEPEAPFSLDLRKISSQEEFIRGSMTKNPYSHDQFGPLMRDVKNKICTDLEMFGLIEDDYAMELLVDGKIISLDLPIRDVFEKVWKKSVGMTPGATNVPPMVVVYRLQGLDGEATEERIDQLEATDKEQNDPEEEYKSTAIIGESGGLSICIEFLDSIKDFEAEKTLLVLILQLLSYCCNIKSNRRVLWQANIVGSLLEKLRAAFALENSDEVSRLLLHIIESIVAAASEDTQLLNIQQENGMHLEMLLERLESSSIQAAGNRKVVKAMTRIIPFLAYGIEGIMKNLTDFFNERVDFNETEDPDNNFYLDCFEQVVDHIPNDQNGHKLKSYMLEHGLFDKILASLETFAVPSAVADMEEWKQRVISSKNFLLILKLINELSNEQPDIQERLLKSESFVSIVHEVEKITSKDHIGSVAENFLDSLVSTGTPALRDKIVEARDLSKARKKDMAMQQREKMLKAMGFSIASNEQGGKIVSTTALSGLEDVKDEGEFVCCVCREGYINQPDEVLGIYTFAKLGTIHVVGSTSKSSIRAEKYFSTVTHFHLIHYKCHQLAVLIDRGSRPSRDEWTGATMRNSNTKCNNLLPTSSKEISSQQYGELVDRHFSQLSELGTVSLPKVRLVAHDIRSHLLKFAFKQSFSTDSLGGERDSNVKLFPFQFYLGSFLLDRKVGANTQRAVYESTLQQFFREPEKNWLNTCGGQDDVLFMLVLSLLLLSHEQWKQERFHFLQRVLLLGYLACNGKSPTAADIFQHTKPLLIYFYMVEHLRSVMGIDKANKNDEQKDENGVPNWVSQMLKYISVDHDEIISKCNELLSSFEEEALVIDSFQEFFDVLEILPSIIEEEPSGDCDEYVLKFVKRIQDLSSTSSSK